MSFLSLPILHLLQDGEDSPNTPEIIEDMQRAVDVRFPADYCEFLLRFNGGFFRPWAKFDLPFPQKFVTGGLADNFLGNNGEDFDDLLNWTEEFRQYVADPCVPICRCATANWIVLKYTGPDSVFDGVWLWDREADPDLDEQILHPIADSFADFLSLLRASDDEEEIQEKLPLFQAIERGSITAIQHYLAEGGDPNKRNAKGHTLLAAAANHRWPQIVRLLLEHSADPNARDKKGRTPLHHAAVSSLDSVKLLIAAGADATARDNKGKSVLGKWCYRSDRILRAHGAEE